jgi:hypothetical protein
MLDGSDASRRACLDTFVHLPFLPPCPSEFQPDQHLWPPANTALINRHLRHERPPGRSPGRTPPPALQAHLDLIRRTMRRGNLARMLASWGILGIE